jgi:hypothetical protein
VAVEIEPAVCELNFDAIFEILRRRGFVTRLRIPHVSCSRRDHQYNLLLVINGCVNGISVKDKKHFHGRVADAFVAVDEG